MKFHLFLLALLMAAPCTMAQKYGAPSIDIVYLLSINNRDTVCVPAERPRVEFEKEKKSLWGKIKDKTTEGVDKAKDAAADKGWIKAKHTDPVAEPDPEVVARLDSVPLVTKSFKAQGQHSTCQGGKGKKYALIVRSNHSYVNPRELVQILPLVAADGQRSYTYTGSYSDQKQFLYCEKVDKYDSQGSYYCTLNLEPGEYAVSIADQPTLVHFFSIPE